MSDSANQIEPGLVNERTSYTCPGELYSISRGIHLSRLAAFYSKCRDCKHRHDAGHVFPREDDQQPEAAPRPTRQTLVSDESVRGVYLNELDRNRSLLWGEALAACLWDQQPMVASQQTADPAQIVPDMEAKPVSPSRGPVVVVGFDERASSPDIVTGVVQGLRRMGCLVIDLAQTALPVVAFGVHANEATAGLFVTGAGCDPSVTGFEILDRGGLPFSSSGILALERFAKSGVGRQTRQIGGHKPQQVIANYQTDLESSFHALRPLRIVSGSSTRLLPRVMERLFAKLPCTLTHVPLPTRRRNLFDGRDVDLQRVATAVVEGQNHLGVVIDEDGRHTAFITDKGRLVSPREVARMVIEIAIREHRQPQFVVATSWLGDAQRWLTGREANVIDGGEVVSELVRLLVDREAVLALTADGRIWFGHAYPKCDAMLVLASVLQALSLSDASFSDVVARMIRDTEKPKIN